MSKRRSLLLSGCILILASACTHPPDKADYNLAITLGARYAEGGHSETSEDAAYKRAHGSPDQVLIKGYPGSKAALLLALKNGNSNEQWYAAHILGSVGDYANCQQLAEIAKTTRDEVIAISCLTSLSRLGGATCSTMLDNFAVEASLPRHRVALKLIFASSHERGVTVTRRLIAEIKQGAAPRKAGILRSMSSDLRTLGQKDTDDLALLLDRIADGGR